MVGVLALAALCGTTEAGCPGVRLVVAPSSAQYPRNTEGSIVRLSDGTLLLAWSRFYGGIGDASSAEIAACFSRDGGRTWERPFVLQANAGRQNVMSVSQLRLASGRIGFFYLVKNGDDDLQVWARYSSDEAKTWTDPVRVSASSGYHVMNNDRVVQLSSGRIICPVSFTTDCRKKNLYVSFCLYSDDEGGTWRRSSPDITAPARGAMEPGVVELADGKLMMIIRTQQGRIFQSFSQDKGATWSEAAPSDVVAPEAPASIKRIPGTDRLLLIWNNNYEPGASHCGARTPLTAVVSDDSGRTWCCAKNIEDDPLTEYAYTSIGFDSGSALLTYYEKPSSSSGLSLIFRRVPISWFALPSGADSRDNRAAGQ